MATKIVPPDAVVVQSQYPVVRPILYIGDPFQFIILLSTVFYQIDALAIKMVYIEALMPQKKPRLTVLT
jgi:hypothetical protein